MDTCDLQVDVNGEGVFMVNKEVLSYFSDRLRKLFGKSCSTRTVKVIYHDFPGGVESFELIARFCYNHGSLEINPSNISILYSAAHFMEMSSLIEQTEKSLDELNYWSWSDLLGALKRSQDYVNSVEIMPKILDAIVGRLALASEASPCPSTSSPDSTSVRFSCDSRSTESLRTSSSRTTWWFEDFLQMNHHVIERAVKLMLHRRFDHAVISRFLFFYQKAKFVHSEYDEKCRIMDMVINMLYSLESSSVSYKSLSAILRVALTLSVKNSNLSKLDGMIGSRLDEATLDTLLVQSPSGVNYLYDVNLVLRFFKSFSSRGLGKVSHDRVSKVANLMDLYLAEVAPDPCLKPLKFITLAMALPDSARESFDEMYHAIDMYLEVHLGLSEEERLNICCVLNYEKLSSDTCFHLAQNEKFPSRSALQALVSQQTKLKSLLQEGSDPKSCNASPCSREGGDQVVLYAGNLDVATENEKLKSRLKGMQCRVMELEKACRKMQNQMSKMTKSRSSSFSRASSRSLPKLCS